MKQSLEAKVLHAITSHKLLLPGEKCLVAVSGGLDSMVLLHLLHRFSENKGWALKVAHFNHKLRGEEADEDEAFVQAASEKLGLPFISEAGNVREIAASEGISTEMAARNLRYQFLSSQAVASGINKIALAHHQDDQLENFFLKFFRGTMGKGIAGMTWASSLEKFPQLTLIRPLLEIWKSELVPWASQEGIFYRYDATNTSNDITRNKVRNKIIPELIEEFPALRQTVSRWQSVIGAEKDYVINQAKSWLKSEKREDFDSLHPALQRELIHQQLILTGIVPTYELIENLRLNQNRFFSVSHALLVQRLQNGLLNQVLLTEKAFNFDSVTLLPNSETNTLYLSGGVLLYQQVPFAEFEKGSDSEFFDAFKVGGKITIRYWQPGDRFQPIGMPCSVKLQDLFTNAKIDAQKKRKLLLAEAENGEIFWVERLRIGENFKVQATTEKLLKWEFRPVLSEQVD